MRVRGWTPAGFAPEDHVDMDTLCRLEEAPLRQYMRDILDRCMPKGHFVFGIGNTVTNYTPIEHYLWLLDESRRWRPS
jgi:hypothetical protein